jgi:acyl dehydratase
MLPQEVTQLIGKTGETVIMEVEKGAIKKFADAVGDRNPLYWDEEYARNSRYGSIVAPPGFFGWPTKWKGAMPFFSELRQEVIDTIAKAGYSRILDGGIEFDFFQPVRPGDILASVPQVTSIQEREAKGGKMVLSITETTYTNQNGDIVAKARQTIIHR